MCEFMGWFEKFKRCLGEGSEGVEGGDKEKGRGR